MASPPAHGAVHREPRRRDSTTTDKARLASRLRCCTPTHESRHVPTRHKGTRGLSGRLANARGTAPSRSAAPPLHPTTPSRGVAATPATLTGQGSRAPTRSDPARKARTKPPGFPAGNTPTHTNISHSTPTLTHTHLSPRNTSTTTITTAPTPKGHRHLLCPRQATTGSLAVAQHTTPRTDKRGLPPTQNTHARTTLGPGISLHVATQKKQEPRIERVVRPVAKQKSESEKAKKQKREEGREGKRIRTIVEAAPHRPGLGVLP